MGQREESGLRAYPPHGFECEPIKKLKPLKADFSQTGSNIRMTGAASVLKKA